MFLHPYGYNLRIIKPQIGIIGTPVVLEHGVRNSGDLMIDPIHNGLGCSWYTAIAGLNLFPVMALSSHTMIASNILSEKVTIRCRSSEVMAREIHLNAHQYTILMRALDFVLQTVKGYMLTKTFVGASIWRRRHGIDPQEHSKDLSQLISTLIGFSYDHENIGVGFLLLSSILITRRLIGIDMSEMNPSSPKQWGDAISRRLFFCNHTPGVLATCYLIREAFLANNWQWTLDYYQPHLSRFEYLEEIDITDDGYGASALDEDNQGEVSPTIEEENHNDSIDYDDLDDDIIYEIDDVSIPRVYENANEIVNEVNSCLYKKVCKQKQYSKCYYNTYIFK